MKPHIRLSGFAWMMAAVLASDACDKSPTAPGNGLVSLSITGPLTVTAIGQTFQLTATAGFSRGADKDVTTEAQWTSADHSVATVSASGLVTVVGPGVAAISAQYQSLTATQAVNALIPASRLIMTGNLSLSGVGDTSQLRAIATLVGGSTADVTNAATWVAMTNPSVVNVSKGLVTAVALGWGQINVTYSGQLAASPLTVTPPGTYVIRGFVKLPGHAGVADFLVRDTQSGRSTLTSSTGPYSPGWYSVGGLAGSTRLTFDKAGYEPAELVVTGPATNGGGEVKVQQLYRVTAGGTVQTTIAPHDVSYDVSPAGPCVNCRMIRVQNPASGILHLMLTWDAAAVGLRMWIDGQVFNGAPGAPLAVDVPVGAGELMVYVGTGHVGYVGMTLKTSLTTPVPMGMTDK